MTDLVEQLRAQAMELRERASDVLALPHGDIAGRPFGEPVARQLRSLADLIDGTLAEHWQTKQPWEGGTVLIDACGRCRYGDGVCYPAPCQSLQLLAAHVPARRPLRKSSPRYAISLAELALMPDTPVAAGLLPGPDDIVVSREDYAHLLQLAIDGDLAPAECDTCKRLLGTLSQPHPEETP